MSVSSYAAAGALGGGAAEINPLSYRQAPRATAANWDEARKVGRDFEQMFLSQMMQPMFEGIEPNPITGGGYAEKTMRSLQLDEFSKSMAKAGGIGLSEAIARDIIRMQEKANG